MSEEHLLEQITRSLEAIETNWPTYNRRRIDYRRGSLPTNSMPEHVAGSSEPTFPERDALEQRITEDWTHIKAGLIRIRTEVRGIEGRMAYVVNATKRIEDPTPKVCANPHCPDVRIFTMIGRDRPQDATGRCDPCRKYHGRNQRERTSKTAYTLDPTNVRTD